MADGLLAPHTSGFNKELKDSWYFKDMLMRRVNLEIGSLIQVGLEGK